MNNQDINYAYEILCELQRTNQLLTEMIQSQWALIEAIGDDVEIESQAINLDGNGDNIITPSQTLDLP